MRLRVATFLAVVLGGLVAAGPAHATRCGENVCQADLSVSGHAEPQPIRVGEESAYKFTIRNNGPDTALAVKLNANVPQEAQIIATEVYGGRSCSVSGTFVQCELGDFVNYQEAVIKIKVKGTRAGSYLSRADVFGYDIVEPSGGNNQVTATLGVQERPGGTTGTGGSTTTSGGSTGGSGAGGGGIILSAKDPQRILKTGGVTIRSIVGKTGTLKLRGSVRTATGATIPLASVARGVRSGETIDAFLGTTAAAKARIRRAFRGHGRLEVNVLVTIGVTKAKIQLHVRI